MSYKVITRPLKRIDAREKVTGEAKFGADLNFSGQLYAKTVYSRYPHARVLSINTAKAEALHGVEAVITAADVPGENELFGRFPVFAEKEVKYTGDGVAMVAATSKSIAEKAASLVEVEYEELPAVLTIEEALAHGAALVHTDAPGNFIENTHHLMRAGDVERGFEEADIVLEKTYRTQFVEHGYIEPEVVIALPEPYRRGVEIHGSIQNPYSIRENVARALNLRISEVRVIPGNLGGSFGGKDESVMLMAARTAITALKTGRPVKMVLTREESILESAKRHSYKAKYKIGARKGGTIVALENTIYTQGGAYNNKARFANWRASVHAAGPYRIPNVKTDLYGVYTNTIYGGAFRGFSAPQVVFCNESLMDELAAELGISPKEIRLKNCLKPGDELVTGQVLRPGKIPAPLKQMIEEVCSRSDFDRKREEFSAGNSGDEPVKRGIGLACTFRGTGLGGEGIDTAGATVTIEKDGSVNIVSNLNEMGQGMRTAHAQIVAETLGISYGRITFSPTDTSVVPDGGPTVASRGTLAGGNAMLIAAQKLKERLLMEAGKILNCSWEGLVIEDEIIQYRGKEKLSITFDELIPRCIMERGLTLSAQGWYNPGPEELDPETGRGNAYPSYIYGCAVAEIRVNTLTGKLDVDRITAAYELGRVINPQIVKGQLMGGLIQGMGYGIMEDTETKEGYLITRNFDELMLPTSLDIPEIDIILYETDQNIGPYGAKGIGEIGVELSAPAIANALFHATGRRVRELPMNLERVLLGRALKR